MTQEQTPETTPPTPEEVMALLAKVSVIYAQAHAAGISDEWDQHAIEVIITQKTETLRLDAVMELMLQRLGISESDILLRMAVLMKRELEEMQAPKIAIARPGHGPRQNGRGKLIS